MNATVDFHEQMWPPGWRRCRHERGKLQWPLLSAPQQLHRAL